MNPLLDIVFIMLIFFIVTAVFIRERGLDLGDSSNSPPNPDAAAPIVVRITADDTLFIEQRSISSQRLSANLSRLHAEQPEANLVIDAHAHSTNNALVLVMDAARGVGITRIGFADRG